MRHGSRRAAGALPRAAAAGRRALVPAVQRARRRQRPGRARPPGPSATATSGSSTARRCGPREAHHADFGILIARTDPDAPKHRGITFFVVDMRTPGIEMRPLVQATGLSHFNEVFLTDVRIPADNVVGEVDGGWAVARTVLASESGMIGGAGQTSTFDAVLDAGPRRAGAPTIRSSASARRRLHPRAHPDVPRMADADGDHAQARHPARPVGAQELLHRSRCRAGSSWPSDLEGAAGMLAGADAPQDGFWQMQVMGQFSSRIGGGTNEVHRNMIGERALGLPAEPRDRQGRAVAGAAAVVSDQPIPPSAWSPGTAYGVAGRPRRRRPRRPCASATWPPASTRGSARLLTNLGLAAGLARASRSAPGQGSMARWLAEQVGPEGRVMATDIDLQFVGDQPGNVILRRHDIAVDPLPAEHFDLAHARAVLQHVPGPRAGAGQHGGGHQARWLGGDRGRRLAGVRRPGRCPSRSPRCTGPLRAAYGRAAGYDGYWGRRMLAGAARRRAGRRRLAGHGRRRCTAARRAPSGTCWPSSGPGPAGRRRACSTPTWSMPRWPRPASPASPCSGPLTISAWGRRPG